MKITMWGDVTGQAEDWRARALGLWWGPSPLPDGAVCLGVVERDGKGALLRLTSGAYVQGNAGTIRTLPMRTCPLCEGDGLRRPFNFFSYECPRCDSRGYVVSEHRPA